MTASPFRIKNGSVITDGSSAVATLAGSGVAVTPLITAAAGLKVTGGSSATETIARTAADTLDINNGAIVSTATAITLAKATTISAGAFTASANTTHVIGTSATAADTNLAVKAGSANVPYVSFWRNTQKWQVGADPSGPGGADGFSIYNVTNSKFNFGISEAGAVTIPTNTIHTLGTSATNVSTTLHIRAGTTTGGNATINLYAANTTSTISGLNFISNTSPRWGIFTGQSATAAGIGLTGFVADAFHLYNAADVLCWQVTQAGAVTIGPASGLTSAHIIQVQSGSAGGSSDVTEFKRTGADAATIKLSGSTNSLTLGISSNRAFFSKINETAADTDNKAVYIGDGNILNTNTSLRASKGNIADVPSILGDVLAMKIRTFQRRIHLGDWEYSDELEPRVELGVIKEEVEEVGGIIAQTTTFSKGVHSERYGFVALKAIQELSSQVEAQKLLLDAANARIEKLENK
jgi:hypothetical protein